MTLRLRPLWMLLLALAWAGLTFWWTPMLDAAAARIGTWTDTRPDAFGTAILWALPWLASGAVLMAGFLIWVVAKPAWHPWRDTTFAVLWAVPATAAPYILVNRMDLWGSFGHYSHVHVDLAATGMLWFVPAAAAAVFTTFAVPCALVAANRIWGTPTPLREETFGPRGADATRL